MKKKSENKVFKFSERVMLATIASSMVLTPTITPKAAEYNISSDVLTTYENADEGTNVNIIESNGDLESASVEWKPLDNASGYNVYYKSESDNNYKQLDNELIRQYPSYFRADIVGVKKGTYSFKIVPIIDGKENESLAAFSENVNVKPNLREGFAFSSQSAMGTGSGGYNDDGSVPDNAQIIYITADNVNSVQANVISNKKGTETTCTGLVDILSKRQKGYDKRPLIIRMIGEIKGSDISGLNSSGYVQFKGCSNVTLEGVGEDATANGWGILIRDAKNVEIRNIGVMLFPDDGISLDTNNENIWIHNNDIFYGKAGSDADQVKGDGSCDVKAKSNFVTVSYNHFYDSGKCSLCGMSDTENFYVTYHHNWFDHSDSRHPRIRVGSVHVYNNYFDGNAKYGVGITKGGSAFVEANYFRNCKNPMLISQQGSDIANNSKGTFSGEPGGIIKAYNNKVEGAARLVYSSEDSTQFDAVLAQSRGEQIPDSYKSVSGGNTYNNFDTDESMYDYTPDDPEDVKDNVTTYAGRVNGGDFGWNFTSEDDESYKVNTELMNKIKAYKSDLVSVGGNSIKEDASEEEKPAEPQEPENTDDNNPEEDNKQDNGDVTDDNTSNDDDKNANNSVSLGSLESAGMNTNLKDAEDDEFEGAIFVSPDGISDNNGTNDSPLDLATALNKVEEGNGKYIILEDGTYNFDKQITINASGSKDGYNVLKASKGADVTLDFSDESYDSKDTSKNDRGIQLNGSYWYIQGITIKGAADNGMMLSGSHNIIERCIFEENRDTGLQISRKSSSVTNKKDFPSYNKVINCTSRNNCDPATYENADGFAAKLTCGEGNVFNGCISYNNSDDGWDLFAKSATGPIGVVTIENCIAMRNGKTEDGTTNANCDGNGFKLGGSGVGTPHVLKNCLAINNLHHGFTDNNNPSALSLLNCTSFDNNVGGKKNNFSLYRCKDARVSNCISYTTNKTSDKLVNLSADHTVFTNSNKWYEVTDVQAMDTGSSTMRGTVISDGTSSSDFIDSNIPEVGTDFDTLWRNDDGSINTNGIGIISEDSKFGTAASDGKSLGARFTDDNEITEITVKLDNKATSDDNNSDIDDTDKVDDDIIDSNDKNDTDTDDNVDKNDSTDDNKTENSDANPSENPSDNNSDNTFSHNFTTSGLSDEFFSIKGSLSDTKGERIYENMTLSKCLKIESSTKITFENSEPSVLTLVFNEDFNGSIMIDGEKYDVVDGVVSVNIDGGSHSITKAKPANLYYISLS